MAERLIAIGDIHGCADSLRGLLELLAPQPNDRLVFLGDYIDRGPDSRGVIQTLIELRTRHDVVTLMGNHEEMMLNVIDHHAPVGWWFLYGGRETMESYGLCAETSQLPEEHVAFLRELKPYHEEEGFLFLHANYVADASLDEQPDEALRWLNLKQQMPGPHTSGKQAIVGHSSQKSGDVLDLGHLICIDTFCVGGGWLTALDVLSGRTWQVNMLGEPRKGTA